MAKYREVQIVISAEELGALLHAHVCPVIPEGLVLKSIYDGRGDDCGNYVLTFAPPPPPAAERAE